MCKFRLDRTGIVRQGVTYSGALRRPPISGSGQKETVRYLGIEVDDALEISEQTEVRRFQRFGRVRESVGLPHSGRSQINSRWLSVVLFDPRF